MIASGFSGLGYQLVWTEQCSTWLGHESAALLAVVAAFFGGIALGGLGLGGAIERSRRPLRWYVGCELVIALWAFLLLLVISPYSAWVHHRLGTEPSPAQQWLVAFSSTFVVLLPATAAMGATLPAMERLTAPLERAGRSISALYAANTLGAVLGVCVVTFGAIPKWGLTRSAALCVASNALCCVLAWAAFPKTEDRPERAPSGSGARGALLRLAATGFLGIGYEVLVVRVLSQVTEDTVYTYGLLLAIYLIGTAVGAAAYRRYIELRSDRAPMWEDRLLTAVAALCLLGAASLWGAEGVKGWLQAALGAGAASALGAEATVGVLAFALPAVAMGALFSHLSRSAAARGVSFGKSLGANTGCAALAPVAWGVVLPPLVGTKLALLAIVFGYLALLRAPWKTKAAWATALPALALALFAPPLRFIDVPEGGQIVEYREGALGAVSVVEDAQGVRRLRINNRQQEGSNASRHVDARQAWLPLLFHPAPRRALFLGLGTGVTASSATEDPSLEVEAVELLPEVIAASRRFDEAGGEQARQRLRLLTGDARRYVRATPRHYDVIVSDNFHPARSGSGALYTVEHFRAVRERLTKSGLYCQWLPLHQLDREALRIIVRSFMVVFPQGWAVLASNSLDTPVMGLMGGAAGMPLDPSVAQQRLESVVVRQHVAVLGLTDPFAIYGTIIAGPSALQQLSMGAPLNTDDRPVVAYRAPFSTYSPTTRPRDLLIALLRELSVQPTELFGSGARREWSTRLGAYWRARNRYIESGRDVQPTARVADMLAQTREPLLDVLRISPDFRPAYDPLLGMATALGHGNVSDARSLLQELVNLQPARAEAAQALQALGD